MNSTASVVRLPRAAADKLKTKLEGVLGGPARTRVIVIFACVLGLESADLATIGAVAPQLEHAMHLSNVQVGLLAAVSTFFGAVATVPFGALTDRVRRVSLLAIVILLWAGAMVLSATAQTYLWLVLGRLALGGVSAAAGPLIASLTGDFFAASERGKIYGYVLSGELLGAGFGFVVSGMVAGALSWRWAFAVLAIPALLLAAALWRILPEPARGGQSQMQQGAEHIPSTEEVAEQDGDGSTGEPDGDGSTGEPDGDEAAGEPDGDAATTDDASGEVAREAVMEKHVEPVAERVLHDDPRQMPLRHAIAYVLRVPTIRWLIIASSVGYFFFAGMRTFALTYVRGHFSLSQSTATLLLFLIGLGSLVAVLVTGRLADRLIRRGILDARVILPGAIYVAAAVLLVPGLVIKTAVIAVPLLILAAGCLSGPNPPLDAARLDIMPALMWGRSEGVRTLVRQTAQAAAPLLFGFLADLLGGAHGTAFSSSSGSHAVSAATTRGLKYAFLIMLAPLVFNGVALLFARRTYPADVATAVESEREVSERHGDPSGVQRD